ncbi:MAG: histidine kinase dimerization/phospho-acceptor domain-containing protein [Anaerolineae bacterium]
MEEVNARVYAHPGAAQHEAIVIRQRRHRTRNTELDAFAHTVAHDLKNALNTIMGHAELLAEDLLTTPVEALVRPVRSIKRMGRKMNNIIEVDAAGWRAQAVDYAYAARYGEDSDQAMRTLNMLHDTHAEVSVPSHWPIVGYGPWVEKYQR